MEKDNVENVVNINNENTILQNTIVSIRNNRETGFEILRIIAIFLISCVHLMNYGGMLENAGGGVQLI